MLRRKRRNLDEDMNVTLCALSALMLLWSTYSSIGRNSEFATMQFWHCAIGVAVKILFE